MASRPKGRVVDYIAPRVAGGRGQKSIQVIRQIREYVVQRYQWKVVPYWRIQLVLVVNCGTLARWINCILWDVLGGIVVVDLRTFTGITLCIIIQDGLLALLLMLTMVGLGARLGHRTVGKCMYSEVCVVC